MQMSSRRLYPIATGVATEANLLFHLFRLMITVSLSLRLDNIDFTGAGGWCD